MISWINVVFNVQIEGENDRIWAESFPVDSLAVAICRPLKLRNYCRLTEFSLMLCTQVKIIKKLCDFFFFSSFFYFLDMELCAINKHCTNSKIVIQSQNKTHD